MEAIITSTKLTLVPKSMFSRERFEEHKSVDVGGRRLEEFTKEKNAPFAGGARSSAHLLDMHLIEGSSKG